MHFDDLKRAWDDCDQELEIGVHLNARRLRSVLMRNADASANSSSADIDFTAPVVVVQKRLNTYGIVRIVLIAASWIKEACRAEEIAGSLQTAVTRVLRRHRTIRG